MTMLYFFAYLLNRSVVGPRYRLCRIVPFDVLLTTKIGAVENLLQAEDLNTFFTGFFNHRDMLLDHGFFDLSDAACRQGIGHLDVSTLNNS